MTVTAPVMVIVTMDVAAALRTANEAGVEYTPAAAYYGMSPSCVAGGQFPFACNTPVLELGI